MFFMFIAIFIIFIVIQLLAKSKKVFMFFPIFFSVVFLVAVIAALIFNFELGTIIEPYIVFLIILWVIAVYKLFKKS